MALKIRQLEIENFRGIDRLELSFLTPKGEASDLVVLAGPNGCGKTSVLEAILLAAGYGELARGKVGQQAVRHGATDFSIRGQFSVEATIVERTCGLKTSAEPVCKLAYLSSWREPRLVGSLGITAGKKGRRPDRSEPNRLWMLKQFLINTRAKDWEQRERQMSLNSFSAGKMILVPTAFEDAMSRLHRVWQRFYPGQSFAVGSTDDTPDSGFDLFVCGPDAERISVDDLSSGQLELLQLAAEFIVKADVIDILLIDEPELHLDPAWHTQILKAIRDLAPQTQLIVATHSPKIYDSAMSFERHFLVSNDDPRAKFWPKGDATSEVG